MKKCLTGAAALLLALALCSGLCGCSMGLSEMLIVKRAYRQIAEMDSLSFTAQAELDASAASIPIKAGLEAQCSCIIDPGTLYMDMEIDMGKLGILELPVYLFGRDGSLRLMLGIGEEDSSLWFTSDFPLSQDGGEGGSLDVEAVLSLLQDDPQALSIGDSETLNGVLCRPFILNIPGTMLMDALGAAEAQESTALIQDLQLTIWIAEEYGSPVRLSADLASLAQYLAERSQAPVISRIKINSLPTTVDITGFNNVESIELPAGY